MSVLFMILAVFCLGYYCFAASYAGTASSFLFFWIVAAGVLATCSLLSILNHKIHWVAHVPKLIRATVLIVAVLSTVSFVVVELLIVKHMNEKADSGADYVVVLGAQVRGTKITKSLKTRLDAAYQYACHNKNAKVIVSGGQGEGEDLSEALAMCQYLTEKGLDSKRILMEDKSVSTKENLTFSKELIEKEDAKIVIVTNNFHVYRATLLAKKLGYESPQGIGSSTDYHLFINYMVREAFALAKEKFQGNI